MLNTAIPYREHTFQRPSIEYDGVIRNHSISFRPTVIKKLVTFQQLSFSYGSISNCLLIKLHSQTILGTK